MTFELRLKLDESPLEFRKIDEGSTYTNFVATTKLKNVPVEHQVVLILKHDHNDPEYYLRVLVDFLVEQLDGTRIIYRFENSLDYGLGFYSLEHNPDEALARNLRQVAQRCLDQPFTEREKRRFLEYYFAGTTLTKTENAEYSGALQGFMESFEFSATTADKQQFIGQLRKQSQNTNRTRRI